MKLQNSAETAASLDALQQCGLLTRHEIEVVNRLGAPDTPPDNAFELAETVHLHIKVSQDELLETEANRRPHPFLDHIGIDLRDETDAVRQTFDALPEAAGTLSWAHASQGGVDRAVYCCHVEVAEKHWLYPPDESADEGQHTGIPLEFAYGTLKLNPDKMGCDLRPAHPEKIDPASISCCGAETATKTVAVSTLSNAAFGRYVSNSTAPRVIQFVAKMKF
jgi:hypothetical protein